MLSPETPRDSAIRAAVQLLGDEDANVRLACLRQLQAWGEAARTELTHGTAAADARQRSASRQLLSVLDLKREGVAVLRDLSTVDPFERLEVGVHRIAELGRSLFYDQAAVSERISELGVELRQRAQGRSAGTVARACAALLAQEQGLRGCSDIYYSRDNVRIDRVLERGRGLTSILTALWLIVGRRAGIQMTAVQLPNWFVVRIHAGRRVLVDPFHGGRTVTRADCLRFARTARPGAQSSEWLADVDDDVVLRGLLEDFLRVHDRIEEKALRDVVSSIRSALGPAASAGR